MKYCIWNNKGGVGKSFLTFCIATEYAIQNPDELVVVADLCPQANVSEILLGGNGEGEENLAKLSEEGRTIADYIKNRYLESRFEKLGSELNYIVKINDYNSNIPENMFLLPGDFELDLFSIFVTEIENAKIKEASMRAMTMLRDVLSAFEKSVKNKKVTFFIDCNPSFAVYTELAIFASDRLIIPCTGDSASLRGIRNVTRILYNVRTDNEKESIFNIVNFYEKAKQLKLNIPILHLGVINKARTFDASATVAYKAHVKKIEDYFEGLRNIDCGIGDNGFKSVNFLSLKDCNNISLIVNHNGTPISKLKPIKYEIYGEDSQVNQSQIDPFLANIQSVIEHLKW